MRLTETKLKKIILEAMNSKRVVLRLAFGDVILDIPKGFYKRKDGPDQMNPNQHQIVILTNDRMKMMDISYDYKTQDVHMNIFVRDPDEKFFDFKGMENISAGEDPKLIHQKFYELIDILKKEK